MRCGALGRHSEKTRNGRDIHQWVREKKIVAAESRKKPPLGVKPHAIAYEERIRELLGAVERNFEHMKTCCMTSEERLGRLHISSDWLQEAILLMELMDKLDEKEDKK